MAEKLRTMGLNSNVARYLLSHTDLIPEKWKDKIHGQQTRIFFWGTILKSAEDGEPYVIYISWGPIDDNEYTWDWHVLHIPSHEWPDNYPAAVLATGET